MPPKITPTHTDEHMAHEWHESWAATSFDDLYKTGFYARSVEIRNLYLPYLKPGGRLLEAGSGPGHVVKLLMELGFQVVGIDTDPGAIEKGKSADPNLDLRQVDVRELVSFADNEFDGYLSFGVVEHFSEGPGAVLREAYRVLKPGGIAVVTAPSRTFFPFVQILDAIKANRIVRNIFGKPPRTYFENHWSADTLRHFVSAEGFAIEKVVPIDQEFAVWQFIPSSRTGFVAVKPFWAGVARILQRIAPYWSSHMTMVIARKPS